MFRFNDYKMCNTLLPLTILVNEDAKIFGGKTKLNIFCLQTPVRKRFVPLTIPCNSRCSVLLCICASFSLFCVRAQGTHATQLLVVNGKIKKIMLRAVHNKCPHKIAKSRKIDPPPLSAKFPNWLKLPPPLLVSADTP